MFELRMCFQPTQGQLGSNRDATITPLRPLPSVLLSLLFRFSGPAHPPHPFSGVAWEDECLAFCFN